MVLDLATHIEKVRYIHALCVPSLFSSARDLLHVVHCFEIRIVSVVSSHNESRSTKEQPFADE